MQSHRWRWKLATRPDHPNGQTATVSLWHSERGTLWGRQLSPLVPPSSASSPETRGDRRLPGVPRGVGPGGSSLFLQITEQPHVMRLGLMHCFLSALVGETEMNAVQSLHSFIPQRSTCCITGTVQMTRKKHQPNCGSQSGGGRPAQIWALESKVNACLSVEGLAKCSEVHRERWRSSRRPGSI